MVCCLSFFMSNNFNPLKKAYGVAVTMPRLALHKNFSLNKTISFYYGMT